MENIVKIYNLDKRKHNETNNELIFLLKMHFFILSIDLFYPRFVLESNTRKQFSFKDVIR